MDNKDKLMRMRDEDERERTIEREKKERLSLTIEGNDNDYRDSSGHKRQFIKNPLKVLSIDVDTEEQ